MRIRHASSKIVKKCVVCSTLTSGSKIYEQDGISIRVPVCGKEDNATCQGKVVIKDLTKKVLGDIKDEINKKCELEEITS